LTYLPSRSPIVLDQLVVLQGELICLGVGIPGSVSDDDSVVIDGGQVVGGELDHCKTALELSFSTWWEVGADFEINTLKLNLVIDLNVWIGIDVKNGNLALGNVVKLLMNKVDDQDFALLSLYACE
jgi:hypothetical protein